MFSKLHVGWSNAVACQNANGTCCFFTASAGLEMTSIPKQIVLKEPTQCQCGCAKTANDCTDAQQFDSIDCSCKCKPPKKPVRCADNWTVMQFFVVKYYCSVCCIHNFKHKAMLESVDIVTDLLMKDVVIKPVEVLRKICGKNLQIVEVC